MTAVRVKSPVETYSGPVGEYVFANGRFEGEISDAARQYFEQRGYTIETLAQARKEDAAAAKAKAAADEAAAAEAQAAADAAGQSDADAAAAAAAAQAEADAKAKADAEAEAQAAADAAKAAQTKQNGAGQ